MSKRNLESGYLLHSQSNRNLAVPAKNYVHLSTAFLSQSHLDHNHIWNEEFLATFSHPLQCFSTSGMGTNSNTSIVVLLQ